MVTVVCVFLCIFNWSNLAVQLTERLVSALYVDRYSQCYTVTRSFSVLMASIGDCLSAFSELM